MAQFICEKQGRCCPHEFYNSIEDAISDSEDGVPCDHLVEVSPVRHGRWEDNRDENGALCNKWRRQYTKQQMLTWYNKLHTDSTEYKMWGNGIALPCALYVMQGIVDADS